jgi:2-polyprenyl-3-methyl-5-hydroxy-6-metoxy-1,4-benzoquinol methylase
MNAASAIAADPAVRCPLCNGFRTRHLFSCVQQRKTWYLAQCTACGLHFTEPQPTAADIRSFYTNDDYHSQLRDAGATEQEFGAKYERYLEWIRRFLPAGRTLDIGCATGLLPHILRRAGYQAEGLELNRNSAEWGMAQYGVRIHTGTLEQFAQTFPDPYDLVTVTDVIEHTENPIEALSLVKRLIKPGGYAMVTFPDIRSVKSRYFQLIARVLQRDWLWMTCNVPFHTWEFTAPIALECFHRCGLSVAGSRRHENYEKLEGTFRRTAQIPTRLLSWTPLSTRFGTQMEFMLQKRTPKV